MAKGKKTTGGAKGTDLAAKLSELETAFSEQSRNLAESFEEKRKALAEPLRERVSQLREELSAAEKALAVALGKKPRAARAAGGTGERANVSDETKAAVLKATGREPKKVEDIAKSADVSKITASNALFWLRSEGKVEGVNRKGEAAGARVAAWKLA